MTPYERGHLAGQIAMRERAAEYAATHTGFMRVTHNAGTVVETPRMQFEWQRLIHAGILSLPIQGETTNPGEQELPAAAAKALPSVSREKSAEDATEGTSAQQPASPGPCVVVPVEPTRAMEDAACAAGDNGNLSGQYLRNIWKAMLAAAREEHAHR